jgi:hypothetical protein
LDDALEESYRSVLEDSEAKDNTEENKNVVSSLCFGGIHCFDHASFPHLGKVDFYKYGKYKEKFFCPLSISWT